MRAYAPAILWGAFLLFLGGRSDVPAVDLNLPLDKAAHFVLYGILGCLAARGWTRSGWSAWYWPVVAALLVGVLDELNQRTIPGRSSELLDWIADAAGIALGFTLMVRRAHSRRKGPG